MPLRVQVFAQRHDEPVVEVGFTQVDFSRPDDRRVRLQSAAGTEGHRGEPRRCTEPREGASRPRRRPDGRPDEQPRSSGRGWTTVVVSKAGDRLAGSGSGELQALCLEPAAAGQRAPGARAGCSPARRSRRCSPTTAGWRSARSRPSCCTRPSGCQPPRVDGATPGRHRTEHEAPVVTRGLTKRFRRSRWWSIAVDLTVPARRGLRLPRAQRLRQDHHHPDAARA